MAVEPTRLLFSVAEYEALGQIGFFGENRRLELIDGEILEMTPRGPEHANRVRRVIALFTSRLGERAVVDAQGPVRLGNRSEPQPDGALLVPPIETVRPPACDGRRRSAARRGVRQHAAVRPDGEGAAVRPPRRPRAVGRGHEQRERRVYRERSPEGYATVERHGRGDALAPSAFPDVGVGVEEILG